MNIFFMIRTNIGSFINDLSYTLDNNDELNDNRPYSGHFNALYTCINYFKNVRII